MEITKLHPHLTEGIINALVEIFQGNRYADKTVETVLKSRPKWGARDRRFFAESVYECVRWRRRLYAVAFCNTPGFDSSEKYLEPEYLTRDSIEKICHVWWILRNENRQSRMNLEPLKIQFGFNPVEVWNSSGFSRPVKESIPDWWTIQAKPSWAKNGLLF